MFKMIAPYAGAIKAIAIALVVFALLGVGYWIVNLKSELAISEGNNVILTESIAKQKEAKDLLEDDIISIQMVNQGLSDLAYDQQQEIEKLRDKFNTRANGQSRDFGAITRDKPGLINKIVNRATVNVNRCLELASGAELQEGETNNECKDLVNTLSR